MFTAPTSRAQKQDIPISVAVVVILVVAGAFSLLNAPATLPQIFNFLELYFDKRSEIVGFHLILFAVNTMAFAALVLPLLSLNQQGKRLEVLAGKSDKKASFKITHVYLAVVASLITYVISRYAIIVTDIELQSNFLTEDFWKNLTLIIQLNLSVAGFFLMLFICKLNIHKYFRSYRQQELPEYPQPKNGIVLGSLGETRREEKLKWLNMNERGLYGNIFITGSIGSGKTQATLSYFEQILTNFEKRPAALLIDPKGNFVSKAIDTLKRLKLEAHIIHMKLGGNIKYNPVYVEDGLKNAKYMEIAQMLRAATSNFIAGSADYNSKFWESLGETLTKNALIYCYAKHGYFTLVDLYYTIVKASKDNALIDDLKFLKNEDRFTVEEKFNISSALNYFELELKSMDEKLRTSILITATNFLNQFQEYQASQVFCPSKEELTLTSFDEWIEAGKILVLDIKNKSLAKSIGTLLKLEFERAVLRRFENGKEISHPVVLLIDEYQDVVSVGNGTLGDDEFLAKAREAKSISILSSQSLSSMENRLGRKRAVDELTQLFRTRIACHSTDLSTINLFKELRGQEEVERESHSLSEHSQHPSRNLLLGGFESNDANISESISKSEHKEFPITPKEFSRLRTFECFAQVYDGVETKFYELCLKPQYLKDKRTLHSKIIENLKSVAVASLLLVFGIGAQAAEFPNICSVVKAPEFNSCMSYSVSSCMCGWPVPRPCAHFSYYIPKTFIEVTPNEKESYFDKLPGTLAQLQALPKVNIPFGAEADDDTHSFQARSITVPFVSIPYNLMPCGDVPLERTCFETMSEHLGAHWKTGEADLLQPLFLAWSASPKACLIKGAITSVAPPPEGVVSPQGLTCSVPLEALKAYPPSSHSACNGWGTFYPRNGIYNGTSQTAGALMVASRIKSIGAEVLKATPSSLDEKWQMISPQSSSCFREGQNVGALETVKNVREVGRLLNGKLKGYLFVVWHRVSCCRDLVEIPKVEAAIAAMKATCQSQGGI